MKPVRIETRSKKMLADVFTPVGIYMRLRDRFRDTLLLESTDTQSAENSWSFICVNAIAGVEVLDAQTLEYKLPGQKPERVAIEAVPLTELLKAFMQRFEMLPAADKEAKFAQGLYGYTAYDAVRFFENIPMVQSETNAIGLLRYRLYQYVIAIHHHQDALYLCENVIDGMQSEVALLESIIRSKDVPTFPFALQGEESSSLTDAAYIEMVKKGIASCLRGDVFQIVLSRSFSQVFLGDEFNVYRALRSINPSPYLFYFDYGDYKIMGSSPEAQLMVRNGKAMLHAIAGTFQRSGDDLSDAQSAERLLHDQKENAEHIMLVDLARNDLSRVCSDVQVAALRKVQYYSHVIHMVSEIAGSVPADCNPFTLLANCFPAGTLTGAPKVKAMQLIQAFESSSRSYYGGAIGYIGFDGSCNHAIMIRSFLSKDNILFYRAGAGVVAASDPEAELQEVNNKLRALKQAMLDAQKIFEM